MKKERNDVRSGTGSWPSDWGSSPLINRSVAKGVNNPGEGRTTFLSIAECLDCGRLESGGVAFKEGWHFDPVICKLCFPLGADDERPTCQQAGSTTMRVTEGERLGPYTVLRIRPKGILYADPFSKGVEHYCPRELVPGLTYFSGYRGMFTDFYDRLFARDGQFFRHVPWWTSPELPLPKTDEVMYWIEFERDNMRMLAYRDEIVDHRID